MALDSCWGISKTGAHLKSTSRGPVGKVVIYSLVSVDGFIAADQDQLGSLFGGLLRGDVPLVVAPCGSVAFH